MRRYIYHELDWPNFRHSYADYSGVLSLAWQRQGLLAGQMKTLGFDLSQEAELEALTLEVEKTSEIEGEYLNTDQVRSSVARQLGMDISGLPKPECNVDGIVELMFDATHNVHEALNKDRLFAWHCLLFPTGRIGLKSTCVGKWRDGSSGAMQVVSGRIGNPRVHFEAPDADSLDMEVSRFLHWFDSKQQLDGLVKAALAHLWFVTIHPFDDGNGRIARAVADMALAQADKCDQRFYSMSAQILKEKSDYYTTLEKTQLGTLEVTEWIAWFLECLNRSLEASDDILKKTLFKAQFWTRCSEFVFNERQNKMLNKLLGDFMGKLNSSKWAKMTDCSHDTANRDIKELVAFGVLEKAEEGGRSTNYRLTSRHLS